MKHKALKSGSCFEAALLSHQALFSPPYPLDPLPVLQVSRDHNPDDFSRLTFPKEVANLWVVHDFKASVASQLLTLADRDDYS